jgi:hypothetical protein
MKFTIKNKEIELTAEEVEEIVKQSKEAKQPLYFVPKMEEEYFVLSECSVCVLNWGNGRADNLYLDRANVYRTKEEAEKEDQKRLALGRIRKYIHENDLESAPNWEDGEDKYQIVGWDYGLDKPITDCSPYIDYSSYNLIFRSVEDGQKVIDNCKDDLRTLLKNY